MPAHLYIKVFSESASNTLKLTGMCLRPWCLLLCVVFLTAFMWRFSLWVSTRERHSRIHVDLHMILDSRVCTYMCVCGAKKYVYMYVYMCLYMEQQTYTCTCKFWHYKFSGYEMIFSVICKTGKRGCHRDLPIERRRKASATICCDSLWNWIPLYLKGSAITTRLWHSITPWFMYCVCGIRNTI